MLLLKLSLRPWRLAPYSQLVSAFAVGFLLLLVGVLVWIQQGLNPVLARMSQEQVITAYLTADAQDENRIVDQIHTALGAQAERAEIKMTSSEEFVEHVKKNYPDLGRDLEDLGQEMKLVVPRYVSISGLLIDSSIDGIRAIPGIESAESSKDRNRSAVGAFSTLRWVAKLLSGGLCLALLTGLVHLARTNSTIHRDSLSLLKLLGASASSLKIPGVASGLYVGILGGTLALAGWLSAGFWICRQVTRLSPVLREMPAASASYGMILLALGAGMGLLAGVFGSLAQKES